MRRYPLDGAMLYFHPATGTSVRVANEATRQLRRVAPRVVMFGVTNACNLACEFCSRDRAAGSAWTVASAAELLRGLDDAGTLEVAFGGGEPFAFRGFSELLTELRATTALAVHATTNGTLIHAGTWPRFAGLLGQVRLSIYAETKWREAAEVLSGHGQRWGANVLVDGPALTGLPSLLAELAALGCRDASLLNYVGPDAHRLLDGPECRRLADLVADSPIECRLSVCFGDRVPSPRLFAGADGSGDCGAGLDFLAITSDKRVKACSFHDASLPGATAADVLAAWRLERARLMQASPRRGCARALPRLDAAASPPPIAIWQAFSGNNSGECVLVARFESSRDAEAYLGELLPGWAPDVDWPVEWGQLFANEGVVCEGAAAIAAQGRSTPRQMVAIGRSVLALGYDAADAFPELRALAWKRGAQVVGGGIHVHDPLTLLVAVRGRDHDDARELAASAWTVGADAFSQIHGEVMVTTIPMDRGLQPPQTLAALREAALLLADSRPCSAEIFWEGVTAQDLVRVMQRQGRPIRTSPRLYVRFWGADKDEQAEAFARSLQDARVTVAAASVLIDPCANRKRLAVLAYRRGAEVGAVDGDVVAVRAHFWREQPSKKRGRRPSQGPVATAPLEALLRAAAPNAQHLSVGVDASNPSWSGTTAEIHTDSPAVLLSAIASYAGSAGCKVSVGVADLDRLGLAVRRVIADVRG